MINARFFIGDDDIEFTFDENGINDAINHLSMLYLEKMKILPIAIFVSPDLYKLIITNMRYTTDFGPKMTPANMQFMTANGIVLVKLVHEPKERFIYAGNQQGYENALIDKRFEEIVFGVED